MITIEQARGFIEENIEELKNKIGIQHWILNIYYDVIDSGAPDCQAECKHNYRYNTASIYIHVGKIGSLEELGDILTHELLHILHHPFDEMMYSINAFIDENKPELRPVFDTLWISAIEKMVLNLERMHKGHESFYKKKG